MVTLRIATFNLENLDDVPGAKPTLLERIGLLRPQLLRLRADVLCLQEVNGQEQPGQPRALLALQELIAGTPYANFHQVSTRVAGTTDVYNERNIVVLSRFPIGQHEQLKNDLVPAPQYKRVTSNPPDAAAQNVTWERPILYARVDLPDGVPLHVLVLHLKSRIPTDVPGQKLDTYTWKTSTGWAEGSFLSAMKRVGQALEARIRVDQLFTAEANARVVVLGDLNGDLDDVPVKALRGEVEETGNGQLAPRVLYPCEASVPDSSRYSLFHHGQGVMFDHVLASRTMIPFYRGTEVHNELLHDESIAFATDVKFAESDHAPVVAEFVLP